MIDGILLACKKQLCATLLATITCHFVGLLIIVMLYFWYIIIFLCVSPKIHLWLGLYLFFFFTTRNDINMILIIYLLDILSFFLIIYNQLYIWTYILPVSFVYIFRMLERRRVFFSDIKVLSSKFLRSSCMFDG